MTAPYRTGRQAKTLEVYRRTRAALIDELGLEPGAKLQSLGELHRAEARWDQATNCLNDSLRLWRESCDSRGNRPEHSSTSAPRTRTPTTGRLRRPHAARPDGCSSNSVPPEPARVSENVALAPALRCGYAQRERSRSRRRTGAAWMSGPVCALTGPDIRH